MSKLALAFAASMALVSVGGGCKTKARETGTGDAMARMRELKDKMCACTDPDCAHPEVLMHSLSIDCEAIGCDCGERGSHRLAV